MWLTSILLGTLLIQGCAGVCDLACLCIYPLAIQALPELCKWARLKSFFPQSAAMRQSG